MDLIRFEKFTSLIDGIHKSIGKLKLGYVRELGVKGVHVSWIYHLASYPEGITATEIATKSMVDRSLVSREIEPLVEDGYVTAARGRRYVLTEKGKEVYDRIIEIILEVQSAADNGLTDEELIAFYRIAEKLNDNFMTLTESKNKKK